MCLPIWVCLTFVSRSFLVVQENYALFCRTGCQFPSSFHVFLHSSCLRSKMAEVFSCFKNIFRHIFSYSNKNSKVGLYPPLFCCIFAAFLAALAAKLASSAKPTIGCAPIKDEDGRNSAFLLASDTLAGLWGLVLMLRSLPGLRSHTLRHGNRQVTLSDAPPPTVAPTQTPMGTPCGTMIVLRNPADTCGLPLTLGIGRFGGRISSA